VRRLSRRRRHQQTLQVQDPRAGLRPSPSDGFPLPRPHAGRRLRDSRIDRHRVRRGRPMNAPVLPNARMNVDEFLAWTKRQPDDGYELVDGEIVAMTRDTVRHNRTKTAVWRTLDDAVRAAGLPCLVLIDGVGVPVNDKTLRIPDVLVQCGAE